MLRKCKKLLAFLLALALVFTTFSSDYASAKVYAEEDTEQNDNSEEEEVDEEDEDEEDDEDEEESDDESDDEEDADDESDDESGDNEENADSEETPEGETPEAETPEDAEEESDDDSEEGLIVITYVAMDGGSVSNTKESFDPNSTEEITLDGSTATADEGYQFVNWTLGEDEISTDATYVPSVADITENVEFIANFEAAEAEEEVIEPEIEMPEQDFEKSSGNIKVFVEAPEGAFPKDTKMAIDVVEDDDILDSIKDAVAGDSDKQNVVAVDITFTFDGEEIEPKKAINVKIKSSDFDENQDTSVVHMDDEGDTEVVGMADVEGTTAEFNASEFSIYGLVWGEGEEAQKVSRRFYYFLNADGTPYYFACKSSDGDGGDTTDHQIIKGTGKLEEIESPYIEGREFVGWYLTDDDKEYTDTKIKFDEEITVPTDLEEDQIFYAKAKYKDHYYVKYVDPDGTFLDSKEVKSDDGTFVINCEYLPSDPDTTALAGWTPTEDTAANIQVEGKTAPYKNNTTVTVTGDVTLEATLETGHWLIFHEVAKGASFTPAEFIADGATTSRPADPTRLGYELENWYTGAPEEGSDVPTGVPFEFGGTITKTTDLYAKWKTATAAPFTIVIEKETLDGDYEYSESIKVDPALYPEFCKVGETVSDDCIKLNKGANDRYAEILGKKYGGDFDDQYIGFTPDSYDSTTKISAEGNTIIKVKFSRIVYNFRFRLGYYNNGSGSGKLWAYGDGSRTDRNKRKDLNFTPGDVDGGQKTNEYIYTSINVKYGAHETVDGDSLWPEYEEFAAIERKTGYKLVSWILDPNAKAFTDADNNGGETVKGKIEIMDDQIIGHWKDTDGNYVDARYDSSYKEYKYFICVEKPEQPAHAGQFTPYSEAAYAVGQTVDFEGKAYIVYEIVPSRSGSDFEGQKAPSYEGYTALYTMEQTYDHGSIKEKKVYTISKLYGLNKNDTKKGIAFYYTRNTSKIIYNDGAYCSTNGTPVTGMTAGSIFKDVDVPFDEDISSYGDPSSANYFVPTSKYGDAVVFDGWYTSELCTEKYEFKKMGREPINVYAGWRLKGYRVFLHSYETLKNVAKADFDGKGQSTSFVVDYHDFVSPKTPSAEGYEFIGWYTDPGYNNLFSTNSIALDDSVTVSYAKDANTEYTERDQYGDPDGPKTNADTNRKWVNKKLDLYARWRQTIVDAKGITVVYDVNGNHEIDDGDITDDSFYADNCGVVAMKYPVDKAPAGLKFDHWNVQTWNGTKFENSDTNVTEGNKFNVLLSNSRKIAGQAGDQAKYIILVSANFEPGILYTKIVYDGNGGKVKAGAVIPEGAIVGSDRKTVRYNKIQINSAIDVTDQNFERDGYAFLGWSTDSSATTPEFKVGDKIAADELDPNDNTLYAVWKVNTGAYSIRYFMGDAREAFYEIPHDGEPIDGTVIKVTDGTEEGQRDYKRPAGYKTGAVNPAEGIVLVPSVLDEDGNITNRQYIDVRYYPITVTVTITGKEYSLPYNGSEQSAPYAQGDKGYTAVVTSNATTADGVTIPTADKVKTTKTIGAKGTNVGDYKFNLSANDFDLDDTVFNKSKGNVTVVIAKDGKLTITKATATVTITGNHDTAEYNRSAHTVNGFEISITDSTPNKNVYKQSDFTFKGKTGQAAQDAAKATRTDVGTTRMLLIPGEEEGDPESATFAPKADGTYDERCQFNNTNKNFDVTFKVTDGYQKITPVGKVTVTITGKTETKTFNGVEQYTYGFDKIEISSDKYTIDDFTFKGKAISMTMTEAVAKGTDVNADGYEMGLKVKDFKNINKNFDGDVEFVIFKDGKLIITPVDVEVLVTGNKETKNFTGDELTTTGFEMTSTNEFFKASDIKFDIDKDGNPDATRNTAIAKGTAPRSNPYPMNLNEGTFAPAADGTYDENCQFYSTNENINVTFKVENGSLTITDAENPIPLALTVASDPIETPYNGLLQKYTMVPGVEPVAENGVAATIDTLRRLIDNFIVIRAQGAEAGEVEFDYKGKTYVAKNVKVTAEGKDVGEYSFTVVGKILIYLDDDEVTNSFVIDDSALANKLTITKAQMNFIADNKSKVAGQVDPTYTATIADLLGDDVYDAGTIASYFVDKELYVFSRDAGETAGNYNIYVKTKEIEDAPELIKRLMSNYDWNYKPGILTITAGGGGGDDTPDTPDTPTTIPDAPVALAPSPAVLGAQRDIPVDGPAVLGARRAGTDDSTNRTARAFIILVSAAVALSLVIAGKKKRKNEEE